MTRQYVACLFNPGDERSYTYHNDGDPVAVNDRVRVPSRKIERVVTVCAVDLPAPSYETKAILGRVETAALDRDPPAQSGLL